MTAARAARENGPTSKVQKAFERGVALTAPPAGEDHRVRDSLTSASTSNAGNEPPKPCKTSACSAGAKRSDMPYPKLVIKSKTATTRRHAFFKELGLPSLDRLTVWSAREKSEGSTYDEQRDYFFHGKPLPISLINSSGF